MPKLSWAEQCRDPRWQKKRLETMKRSGFACESCDAKNKTLNIHHGYYERGLAPWEYPEDTLWCLCVDCHIEIKERLLEINKGIGRLNPSDILEVLGYVDGLLTKQNEDEQIHLESYEHAMAIASFYELSAEQILKLAEPNGYLISGKWLSRLEKKAKKNA